jgi:uncharacterized protein YndB with AHSA1/START domain
MSLDMSTRGDREIVFRRDFRAPRHLVFAAWTRPELLVRWYGADGWRLVECDVDLRVGGAWRFVSTGPDGARMVQSGRYRLVEPPARLEFSEIFDAQSYPGETLIVHDLTERSGTTTVTSTLTFATAFGRDTVLGYPMRRGLGEGYARLDVLLTKENVT